MNESCFIIPTCKNKEGKDVESRLFEDLWKVSGNYEWAEEQYKIATNDNFLNSVGPEAVFDANGQITARSFMDITGITFASDEIKERLSERWEDNNLPAEEVSDRVADFNSKEPMKDDFVPAVQEEGEVVKFTVSQRTPARVSELQSYIENSETLKVIAQRLKDLGVAYDFVGKNELYSGRFSTKNAQKAFDGLYHLIQISDGARVEDALIEESAHLATLACKDSVFINRLLDAINERTINGLFSKEELEGINLNAPDAKLELAGKLVAKSLRNEATPYRGLLGNIKKMIYRIFSKGNLSSLLSAKTRARVMAERLARGFLFEEDMDVNQALKTPATLYLSEPITKEGEKLKEVLSSIKKLGARVRTFSSVAYKDVYAKLSEKAVLGEEDYDSITTEETMGHMTAAVDVLLNRLTLLAEPLSLIDERFFEQELSTDSINQVYEADSICETLHDIINTYRQLGINPQELEESSLRQIDETVNKIKDTVEKYSESIDKYKILYATQLMRECVGRENIDLAADVFSPNFFDARKRKARTYSMRDIVTFYNDELSDTSHLLTFLRTYSNHKDITTQAFYNIVRQTKAKEAIDYNDRVTELINIEKEWKEFVRTHKDFSTLDLFEYLDDGSLTGYFRSDIKTGQFQRDKQDVIRKIKQKFLEDLNGSGVEATDGSIITMEDYKMLTRTQRKNIFDNYVENSTLYEKFLSEAYLDKDSHIYKDKYIDKDFSSWMKNYPEFKALYDKITKYKASIDRDFLTDISDSGGGECHGVFMRVPQFKAGLVARLFKNRRLIIDKELYDYRNTKTICEDVTSDYFGSPLTEEVAFKGEDEYNDPDLRRLALYGINMLETPNDVSTDIFKSLELYTEMACRFHTSQAAASRLELFHSQLNKREVSTAVKNQKGGENKARRAKSIASNKRENILDNFIYAKNSPLDYRGKKRWYKAIRYLAVKAAGTLSAFGAIRALCISPIAGAKNWIAGYRVIAQDVKAGILEDVKFGDILKATAINWAPKHVAGEIGRVLFGETMSFDHYQRLVDRWDSYRTPSKIHRKKGFHPLQTIVNIAMANYSLTDNSLVGIIYHSKMSKVKLYDVNAKEYTTAADAYRWRDNNPEIKEGLLLDANTRDEYRILKDTITKINDIIENNKLAETDDDVEILRLSDPISGLQDLEDFYENSPDIKSEMPKIKNPDGTYKAADEVLKALRESVNKLCFSEETEFKLCSNINDYIISSQGVYGMLNATEFQSGVYTQSLGKIKGYMFGLIQRNWFNNYRITNQKVNHAVIDSVKLALFSVFAGAKELAAAGDITPAQYRLYTAALCFLPPAMRSKECVKHMQRCGWDPDQLEKLTSFAIGFWINFTMGILARMLYRGNERTIGKKVYEKKGRVPLDKGAIEDAIDFVTAIDLYTDRKHRKLIEPGILAPKRAISIDYEKAQSQLDNWTKHDFPKNMRNPEEGYFEPGTKAFDDRVASYELKNIVYDTQDPLYYITGAGYRLIRGVRDEGLTLMNPLRFANDATEMANFGNSIVLSSGLATLTRGVKALLGNEDMKKVWLDNEINFYLGKIGLTYDSKPEEGEKAIQYLDWYEKQNKIERYQDQNRSIPQPWN